MKFVLFAKITISETFFVRHKFVSEGISMNGKAKEGPRNKEQQEVESCPEEWMLLQILEVAHYGSGKCAQECLILYRKLGESPSGACELLGDALAHLQQCSLRCPAAMLFVSRDACSDRIARLFRALTFFRASFLREIPVFLSGDLVQTPPQSPAPMQIRCPLLKK